MTELEPERAATAPSPAETFRERLDILEKADTISPLARQLTELTLAEIVGELGVGLTEDNAAPFVTHLATARTRLGRGEPEAPLSVVAEEEIASRYRERALVERLMKDCAKLLGRTVPDTEVSYVTIHLCAILDDE
jgi:hypothetical protein